MVRTIVVLRKKNVCNDVDFDYFFKERATVYRCNFFVFLLYYDNILRAVWFVVR